MALHQVGILGNQNISNDLSKNNIPIELKFTPENPQEFVSKAKETLKLNC